MLESIIHPITGQSFAIVELRIDTLHTVITVITYSNMPTRRPLISWLRRPLLLNSMYG